MKNKIYKILQVGDPLLRQKARPVTVFHKKLHSAIDSMAETLYSSGNGAALAANQVGILKQIIVIDYEEEYLELLNPVILECSGEQTDQEGCLSFTGLYGNVKRFNYIKIKYCDRYGEEHILEKKGKMSRCIQHEIDHLNGILFIDRMEEELLDNIITNKKVELKPLLNLSYSSPSGFEAKA